MEPTVIKLRYDPVSKDKHPQWYLWSTTVELVKYSNFDEPRYVVHQHSTLYNFQEKEWHPYIIPRKGFTDLDFEFLRDLKTAMEVAEKLAEQSEYNGIAAKDL